MMILSRMRLVLIRHHPARRAFGVKCVIKNPDLINPSGSSADDFKRLSYSGDVASGSAYSTMCGAYETGDEVVGIESSGDTVAPAAPSGLAVE